LVFGQIQDRYFISEQEGTDSSCKYRPELQVSEVGFSVDAQVLNLISESDELCWVHFYFEIVTFALKQLANFLLIENLLPGANLFSAIDFDGVAIFVSRSCETLGYGSNTGCSHFASFLHSQSVT